MKIIIKQTLFVFGFLVTFLNLSQAVPNNFRFQGRLTDSRGNPVVGPDVRVHFALFSTPTGASLVWNGPAEQSVATNEAGLFSVEVGPVNAEELARYGSLYLEVSVYEGGQMKVLSPRQLLSSVPYALQSEYALRASTAGSVEDGAITASKIRDGNVTEPKLAPNSVGSEAIIDGSLQAVDLAPDSVNSGTIKDRSIQDVDLATSAVTSNNIRDGSIMSVDLASGSVESAHIQDRSITATDIADGTVSTMEIRDGTISTDDLGNGVVQTGKIADQAVNSAKIADQSVSVVDLSPAVAGALLPSGLIAMFAQSCPAGWSRFGLLDNRFPLGVSSYTGSTGGNNQIAGLTTGSTGDHNHSILSHTHTAGTMYADVTNKFYVGGDGGGNVWVWGGDLNGFPVMGQTGGTALNTNQSGTHTHTVVSDGTWLPPYLGVVFCRKD
ncbi:MAG: hypothetical protein LHV69_02980 [Elusimicrobia bacterium]|nr:hypothetical protein [Candidatus Obscuribacterium magneticum]